MLTVSGFSRGFVQIRLCLSAGILVDNHKRLCRGDEIFDEITGYHSGFPIDLEAASIAHVCDVSIDSISC